MAPSFLGGTVGTGVAITVLQYSCFVCQYLNNLYEILRILNKQNNITQLKRGQEATENIRGLTRGSPSLSERPKSSTIYYNDNTVPPGTSKRPTDSSAHISNHNETGQFKDSQFLYTIVSKNINTLKLTAHLSL